MAQYYLGVQSMAQHYRGVGGAWYGSALFGGCIIGVAMLEGAWYG